jgi:hypothetical protein
VNVRDEFPHAASWADRGEGNHERIKVDIRAAFKLIEQLRAELERERAARAELIAHIGEAAGRRYRAVFDALVQYDAGTPLPDLLDTADQTVAELRADHAKLTELQRSTPWTVVETPRTAGLWSTHEHCTCWPTDTCCVCGADGDVVLG